MANFLSDQLTNAAANPLVKNNPSTDNDVGRRYFSWTGDAAQNDTVQLVLIKKGERVMNGRIGNTAFGAGRIGRSGCVRHARARLSVSQSAGSGADRSSAA